MNTFKIELPEGACYKYFYWREELNSSKDAFKDYTIQWVNLEKFIYFSEKNPYIPFVLDVKEWDESKRVNYIKGHDPEDGLGFLCTPRVAFHDDQIEVTESKWFGFKKGYKTVSQQYVGFVNGRHRTRIASFLGAKKIPVQVHSNNAELLSSFCG